MSEKERNLTDNIDLLGLARFTVQREARARERDTVSHLITAATALSFFAIPIYVGGLLGSLCFGVNLLFSLMWSLFFTGALLFIPSPVRRIVYCVLYMLLLTYGFAQYVYFGFFGKPISFTAFANAGEGADYLSAIVEKIGLIPLLLFLAFIALGVVLTVLIGTVPAVSPRSRSKLAVLLLCVFITIQYVLPFGIGMPRVSFTWNPGNDKRYVYDNYLDKMACFESAGYYQYLSLDFYNCFLSSLFADNASRKKVIEDYFKEYRTPHEDNSMTALLKGKNVVLIMLESMDYLALYDEQNTPTIHKMMAEGMNFTNYYAPMYGDGATFSNEFSLNTGIITPTNGKTLYNYISNTYSESLAALFADKGYLVNSYHENVGSFYSREQMHMSFGYEKYHSFYSYGGKAEEVELDTYLTRTEPLLKDFLHEGEDAPFFNFLITYSAHLPYYYTERNTDYAYTNYVKPNELYWGTPQDLNCLRAKARITDKMLAELIEACPEDTVFVCATDHYCYGLTDDTKAQVLDPEENLRQRVPFFIYSKDGSVPGMEIDTYCANIDVLPTVANLMGLSVPEYTLGTDIFDPDFASSGGFVIFSDFAVITGDAYYKDGSVKVAFTDSPDTERLVYLTDYGYKRAEASNAILSCNYYK